MKNLIRLLTLFAFAGFLFTACEGPAGADGLTGAAGKDGMNGKDGINGVDANSSCLKCHTTAKWATMEAEYKLSKHYYGTTSSRNTKYCARCHTHEGFEEVVGNGKTATSNDVPNATRVNCKTCHAHSGFDFSGDTVSQILTTTTPVVLAYENYLKAVDYGKQNNLCATCHQIRGVTSVNYTDSLGAIKTFNQLPFFPWKAGQDDQALVSYQVGQSFSVHDGNQANLFSGINAYEYSGQTYTRTWKHSAFSCVDCHMNAYNATDKTGGHSLKPNEAACTACHGGDKITPTRALIDAKRVELAELLTTRKVFRKTTSTSGTVSYSAVQSHDFYGTLFPTTESTTKYATALANGNTVSATTGLVIYGNKVTMAADALFANRIGRQWKYGELGAAYNYAYINSELSLGVHNPVYALQVLQKSIDWLKAN
jgi:formate-dependent nitrite reductase cytochrome c552 subunit